MAVAIGADDDEAAADDAARRVRQQAGARTPWDTDAIQVIVALNFMLEFNTSLEPPIHALNDAVWPNYAAFKERALGRNPEATDMGRAGPVAMRGEGDPRYKETVESLRQEIAVKDAERVAAEAEGDNTSSFDAQIAVLQASLGALVQNEVTRLWYRRDMYRLYNVGEARGTRQPFNPTDNFEPPVPTVDDPTPSATQLRSYLVYEDVYREQKLYRWREEPSGPWVPFGSHTVAGRGVVRTPVLRGAISDELYEGTFARDDQYEPEPEPGPSLTRDTVAFELKGKPAWGYLKKGEALLETDKIFRRNFVKCREEYIGEDPIYYYSAPELRTKYLEMRDDYEDLSDRYHALHKRLKSDRRLEPLIDMVRMRTKRGTEDEVFHKLNRIYNGL